MPGEFFTIIFYKKILTNHFFVTFKCRKAKDGDDNMKGGERWPIITGAVREQLINVLAIVGGLSSYGPLGMWPVIVRTMGVARRRTGRWGGGPLSGSGPSLFGTRGVAMTR